MFTSFKKPMDIFYIVYDVEEIKDTIRSRYPRAKFCFLDQDRTIQDALYEAQSRSTTKMFWLVNFNYELLADCNLDYEVPDWDQQYVHVFKNQSEKYEGVYIIPKHYQITKKEAEHVFFINKKEIDLKISNTKSTDIFFAIYDVEEIKQEILSKYPTAKFCYIDQDKTIQDALYETQRRSSTEMFWFVDIEHEVHESFDLEYRVPFWDQQYAHVFKEEKTDKYKGIYLIPKFYPITKNEAEHVFFVNKKEMDIVAAKLLEYEKFIVTTYDDYLDARKKSRTEMFYVLFSDLTVRDDFEFNHKIDKESRHLNYVFKNGSFYDGIFLTSKQSKITEKEFNSRFVIERSEIDVPATDFENFEIVKCNSYDEYLEKIKTVKTSMFYMVTDNITVAEDFKFDYQVPRWNQDKVHVFKNGKHFDGICLFPKDKIVTQREFNFRFFVNKIEVDINASRPKLFDIVFISYAEPNADENYQLLKDKFPNAKRIHGVKGIHNAHKEAANIVETPMFWVVDGDAQITDNFCFDYQVPVWSFDVVHVCRSVNPINGLEYGYGGVKLLPTLLTRHLDTTTVDMTTSISPKFMLLPIVSNISAFNTDEFNTWKSAFRECVKLASKIITGQRDDETNYRLDTWCSKGGEEMFGNVAIRGAVLGKEFGFKYKNDTAMLAKINDWSWLEEQFRNSESL